MNKWNKFFLLDTALVRVTKPNFVSQFWEASVLNWNVKKEKRSWVTTPLSWKASAVPMASAVHMLSDSNSVRQESGFVGPVAGESEAGGAIVQAKPGLQNKLLSQSRNTGTRRRGRGQRRKRRRKSWQTASAALSRTRRNADNRASWRLPCRQLSCSEPPWRREGCGAMASYFLYLLRETMWGSGTAGRNGTGTITLLGGRRLHQSKYLYLLSHRTGLCFYLFKT